MAFALVSLGANLGDRAATLSRAIRTLQQQNQIRLAATSSFHATAPVGGPAGQPQFLNAAIVLETTFSARQLLEQMLQAEAQFGRERSTHWGARTLDLDLLLYDAQVIDEHDLTVPHPRMAYRRFVLEPAAEIAPEMRHPVIDWTVGRLLNHLNTAPYYLAIVAATNTAAPRLAEAVASRTGAAYCADPNIVPPTPFPGPVDPAASVEAALAQQRADCIANRLAVSPQGVISDFWVEQSLARFAGRGDGESGASHSELESVVRTAPTPRLLALLDHPPALDAEQCDRSYQEHLHKLATRAGRGPFLVLDATNLRQAEDELSAAMLAMR